MLYRVKGELKSGLLTNCSHINTWQCPVKPVLHVFGLWGGELNLKLIFFKLFSAMSYILH